LLYFIGVETVRLTIVSTPSASVRGLLHGNVRTGLTAGHTPGQGLFLWRCDMEEVPTKTDMSIYDEAMKDIGGVEGLLGLLEMALYSEESLHDVPGLAWLLVDAQDKAERVRLALSKLANKEVETN
jgi:hypothetical protein